MREVYLLIKEKKALIRELYGFPKTKLVRERIRVESRLLGELEHKLTLLLTASPMPAITSV